MAIVGSSLERFLFFWICISKRIFYIWTKSNSVDDIARTSPCVTIAKAGTGLAKDLYDGKDVKTAATDRYVKWIFYRNLKKFNWYYCSGQEALVTIGGGVVEVIIDVVKGLKNGQILDALKRYTITYSMWMIRNQFQTILIFNLSLSVAKRHSSLLLKWTNRNQLRSSILKCSRLQMQMKMIL